MKHVLLVFVLLGCGQQLPDLTDARDIASDLRGILSESQSGLRVIISRVERLCDAAPELGSHCGSARAGGEWVGHAFEAARRAVDAYEATGLGLEVAHKAIDHLESVVSKFNAELQRYENGKSTQDATCSVSGQGG